MHTALWTIWNSAKLDTAQKWVVLNEQITVLSFHVTHQPKHLGKGNHVILHIIYRLQHRDENTAVDTCIKAGS